MNVIRARAILESVEVRAAIQKVSLREEATQKLANWVQWVCHAQVRHTMHPTASATAAAIGAATAAAVGAATAVAAAIDAANAIIAAVDAAAIDTAAIDTATAAVDAAVVAQAEELPTKANSKQPPY